MSYEVYSLLITFSYAKAIPLLEYIENEINFQLVFSRAQPKNPLLCFAVFTFLLPLMIFGTALHIVY